MKKLYTTFLFSLFLFVGLSYAQSDTLLFEDFQDSIPPNTLSFPDPDSSGTNNWVNWDEDNLADANNRPQEWYIDLDFVFGADDTTLIPIDTNLVLVSSSWLQGFADGNRNLFITPPIQIVDDQAMLYWESAPFQGPRYIDGYSVVVSTSDYDPGSFSDTLFRHTQMIPPLPATANDLPGALEPDSFLFSPASAYMHADRYTIEDYFTYNDGETLYTALLEPHSASLADFVGETIFIMFLHDSDDDNLISIDNILVTGSIPTSNKDVVEEKVHFQTFPNPVKQKLIVNYRLEEKSEVQLGVYGMDGNLIRTILSTTHQPGNYTETIRLADLPAGTYFARLMVNGELITRKIIKQ